MLILSIGVLFLLVANIFAEKTITCDVYVHGWMNACEFFGVTIGPNETIKVETNPAIVNIYRVSRIWFSSSSIYSVPSEVFTEFPIAKSFGAPGNKIQEIKPNTFAKAKNLEDITLSKNLLTFLHLDTFKGKNYSVFESN